MQELQHLAKLREQTLVRSSHSCKLNDIVHVPAINAGDVDFTGKREDKKRKRKEMLGIAETQEKLAEMGRGRSTFEGGKHTLPSIGHIEKSAAKLPKMKPRLVSENNVIDIISRNEASVKVRSKLKEISDDYLSETAKSFTPGHPNNAPEVIAKYEGKVGRAYHGMSYDDYAEYYETTCRATSRCLSAASRRSD